jgi:hypothetical protein
LPQADNPHHVAQARIIANTIAKQGGKNRRRGKNENDNEKRELTFKEEGQGTKSTDPSLTPHSTNPINRIRPGPQDARKRSSGGSLL